jgi:hypothetical protein
MTAIVGVGSLAGFYAKSRREMDLERWTVGGHHSGIGMTASLILAGGDPYHGVNAGFMALCFNFAVTALVSRMTTARVTGFDETLPVPGSHPLRKARIRPLSSPRQLVKLGPPRTPRP